MPEKERLLELYIMIEHAKQRLQCEEELIETLAYVSRSIKEPPDMSSTTWKLDSLVC